MSPTAPYRIRYIVNNDGSGCPSVVHGSERMVSLLAGSVPNLELHRHVIHGHGLRQKRSSNSGLLPVEGRRELSVISIPGQQVNRSTGQKVNRTMVTLVKWSIFY